MSFTSITQRFLVWFLVISLLPILLIGYSLLHTFEKELQQTVAQQISTVADKKVDQIDHYLSDRVQDAMVKSQGNSTRRAVIDFTQAFARGGVESDAYRQLDASNRDYFKRFVISAGYHDLFLISPQGAVVYSYAHEADFATNLLTGPYRNSGLAKVTRNVLGTLESSISDFELYAPSGNAIAAFIAVPIMVEGKLEGVLALQLDSDRVFQVLTDDTGLGISGETMVARLEDQNTALVMAPLNADPDAALKRKIQLDTPPKAEAIRKALHGLRGSGVTIDYRGAHVVAAWRYLPRMGWGMVVKMDADEAFAPVYRMRNYALIILGLAVVVATLAAFLLGRRIVIPLKNLSRSVQNFADGKLDQRVPVVGDDELGELAVSFNAMAEQLQSSYASLERRVEQRTSDLTLALKQQYEAQKALQRERDFAARLLNTAPMIVLLLDPRGIIEYVNPYFEQLSGYRLDEVKGKDWFTTFLPEQDRDSIRALFQKATHDIPTRGNINSIVIHSGEMREIEWHDQCMRDAQGTVISVLATGQDVTVRHLREQEIQRLVAIVRYSHDFIGIADLEGHVQFVNEAGRQLVGISDIAHCYDTVVTDYIAEAEREHFMPKIMATVMEQGRWVGEANFQHFETGALIPMLLDIFRIDDPITGRSINFATVCRDMREQKAREAAMHQNEARLNEAQRIARVGSWELNLLTGELLWTDEIFRLFEIDKNQFGATYEAFLNAIHPDDRDSVNQAYTASLANRMPYEITHRLRMSDGRIKWVQERCSSEFDAEGKPILSVGTVQDITERKLVEQALEQSELLYRTLAKVAPVGIFHTDLGGACTYVNEQYCEISGRSCEAALGTGWSVAIHPDDRACVFDEWNQSVKKQEPYKSEFRFLHPGGQVIWVTVQSRAEMNSHGEVLGYVGTITDITERKRAEAELKRLNEELEQRVEQRTRLLLAAKEEADRANNAKSEFLSRMSHELRTPMNAVMGFSQLLETDQENPLTSDQLDNVHEILNAGQHLLELINEVLDLARVESGRIDLSMEPVEVLPLIKECVALLQPLIAEQQIELTLDTGNACTVQADRMRLRQVLLNLLSNAIKYNRKAGSVQIDCRPAREGIVKIMVRDSGRGIPVDALPRLFKPFERIESAYDGIDGTGIGLALSKSMVEAMKGTIGMESVVDEGSSFWVELPVAEVAVCVPPVSTGVEVAQNASVTVPTLLYVEDNRANLRLVQRIISTHTRLKMLDARTAEQGLEIARMHHPDLILLDINLPGMDGFEALRHLQDDPVTCDIPVIAISANAMERDVKKGLAAGFTDYLTKPLDIHKLLTLLNTYSNDPKYGD